MDISGISTSLHTAGLVSQPARGELKPADDRTAEVPREKGISARRGLALGILKQELAAWFRARSVHGHARAPATAGDVADEAIGAARQAVAESPSTAARSLISFRARVEQAAAYAREVVASENEAQDIDDVVAKVGEGLDELENEVANYRESSASVLSVDTRSKQRSTIQIRTQEGDIVRFSLKRVDSMSASDVAYADGEMSITSTEVSVSSRSRMMMSVEGDLNEAETAAIQNVFAQAEMIADEFFDGDIGAAFNVAQGFEFDTEQLARVNMRFRMHEMTNVAYAETVRAIPAPTIEPPVVTPPVITPVVVEAPVDVVAKPAPVPNPILENIGPDSEADARPDAEPAVSSPGASAIENFLDALGAFLRTVGDGFASSGSDFRYHYSDSFKLEMLKAVLHTVAPSDALEASDKASSLIDGIVESAAAENDS